MSQAYSSIAVLIVEDEPLVRFVAEDLVAEAGFTTFVAGDADEAVRLLERHENIRILFTDVDMPGTMDGIRLAHYVRHRWHPVQLIVTSGFMRSSAESLPDGAVFLRKPYMAAQIHAALAEMAARVGQ
jgi:CheY-like chemotaxis protein